jgi:uncharacterized protein YkwD
VRGAIVIAVAAIAMVASIPASAAEPSSCAGTDQLPAVVTVAQTRSSIVCLINAARTEHDLPTLHVDSRLQRAAQRFARTLPLAAPLTHRGPGGSTPTQRITVAGYPRGRAFSAAETLGRSHGTLATPAIRIQHWLGNSTTRLQLLSARYRDIGIGVVTQGDTTTFVVELGRRNPPRRATQQLG